MTEPIFVNDQDDIIGRIHYHRDATIADLERRLAEATNALMVSEQYRRAYRSGKMALYSMGGEVCDAAMKHLPCGEGPLDRYTMKIERDHSPLLVEHNKQLCEQLAEARRDGERLSDAERLKLNIRANAMTGKWEVVTSDLHPSHRKHYEKKTLRAAIDAACGGAK